MEIPQEGRDSSQEESRRKPVLKELWSPPLVDPVFEETGIGYGERISWEVLSPRQSQTPSSREFEDVWNSVGRRNYGSPLYASIWHLEDETDYSWRENRYGCRMDPFDEEQYIKRGCSNGFNHSEVRGIDEDLESERRESEAGILHSQENVEQPDMEREISEKEMHSVRKVRAFPPLLTSLPNKSFTSFSHLMPPVLLKPLRSKGRLVLQEAKVAGTAMFQPVRRDGRLLLQLPRQDDDQYLALNEELEEVKMGREDTDTEKPIFEATGTMENLEALGKPSNDVLEMGQRMSQAKFDSMELNQCSSVLCQQSEEGSLQLVTYSEDVKAGFDRQHSDKVRTKFVSENETDRCSTNTEAWDSVLPENIRNNCKGVAWTKPCGDAVKQDVQTIAFTNSDQAAGPVNLTKSPFEGRCFYSKEHSIEWHLAASQVTKV